MLSDRQDSSIELIYLLTAALLLTSFVVLIIILWMRHRQNVIEQQRSHLNAVWTPIMARSIEHRLQDLPRIKKRDQRDFLIIWNRFQGNLRGEAKQGLNRLLEDSGMDRAALSMLKSRTESERVLGALTMGHLQRRDTWNDIEEMALNQTGLSGQVAALSLARIDPAKASPILIPLFARRIEWPRTKIASTLLELGSLNVTRPLLEIIEASGPGQLPRLISFLYFAEAGAASKAVRRLLNRSDDIEIISACLKECQRFADEGWADLILPYLKHTSWIVRVQAVNVLAGVAGQEHTDAITALLSDENWWVRFRAAQALASLPFMTPGQLEKIIIDQGDRYAIDILKQVQAEKGMRSYDH